MRLVTPDSIRKLQRKLYLKAKQEPTFRFYSLYDKIHRPDILDHAYRLVKANRGNPGIDGISFDDIEKQEGLTKFLPELGKGYTNYRQPHRGRLCMLLNEEHRKAVCGKTACTV